MESKIEPGPVVTNSARWWNGWVGQPREVLSSQVNGLHNRIPHCSGATAAELGWGWNGLFFFSLLQVFL